MFIGIFSAANVVTLLGLTSATISCFLAAQGNIKFSIVMLLLSALCDSMDGMIARQNKNRTQRDIVYGIQLDSLCDVISFGFTPCYIAYHVGFNGVFDLIIFIAFIMCGAIRLAYYNTLALDKTDNKPVKYFHGLPIPASSVVMPIIVLLMTFIPHSVTTWLFRLTFIVVAALYVLNVKIKKPSIKTIAIIGIAQFLVVIVLYAAGDVITA